MKKKKKEEQMEVVEEVEEESCEICMYMERIPSRVSSRVPSRWLLPVLHMGNAVGKEERERGTANTFFPASV